MNAFTIDNSILQGVENYAREHRMSVNDVVERSIMFFLKEHGKPSKLTNTPEFITALTKMQKLSGRNAGSPVPSDENGMEALTELKYAL